jgi:hypothetical protein
MASAPVGESGVKFMPQIYQRGLRMSFFITYGSVLFGGELSIYDRFMGEFISSCEQGHGNFPKTR